MRAGLGGAGRDGHLCLPHPAPCSSSKPKLLRHPVVNARIKGEENQLRGGTWFKQCCPTLPGSRNSANFLICRQEHSCTCLDTPICFGGSFQRGFLLQFSCFELFGMGCKLLTWRAGSVRCLGAVTEGRRRRMRTPALCESIQTWGQGPR